MRPSNSENRNSLSHTLIFALAIAVSFGSIVSVVSIWLEPLQDSNREEDQQQLLQSLLQSQPGFSTIADANANFELSSRWVDFATGCYADELVVDLQPGIGVDTQLSGLPRIATEDLAGFTSIPAAALVHLILGSEGLVAVVLPVYGLGYQSQLKGYLTVSADGNTAQSLVFYEQQETPGMGARISQPEWQASWQGKQISDPLGKIRLGVATTTPTKAADTNYQIDAMTGASITGRGVTSLLQFWVGPQGFGLYLDNLRSAKPCVAN